MILKSESELKKIEMHSTMHSNAENGVGTRDLNISSIGHPSTSVHYDDISSATLNFSDDTIEQQIGSTENVQGVAAGDPEIPVIGNEGPSKRSEARHIDMAGGSGSGVQHSSKDQVREIDIANDQSNLSADAVTAGLSNNQLATGTDSSNVQATGLTDLTDLSCFSSEAPELSANTQQIMVSIFKQIEEEEKED